MNIHATGVNKHHVCAHVWFYYTVHLNSLVIVLQVKDQQFLSVCGSKPTIRRINHYMKCTFSLTNRPYIDINFRSIWSVFILCYCVDKCNDCSLLCRNIA